MVGSFGGFNIGGVEIFFHHILKRSAVMLECSSNALVNAFQLFGHCLPAAHGTGNVKHVAGKNGLGVTGRSITFLTPVKFLFSIGVCAKAASEKKNSERTKKSFISAIFIKVKAAGLQAGCRLSNFGFYTTAGLLHHGKILALSTGSKEDNV